MPSSFDIGEIVGDYRVVGVLGAGGSGEVFKAEHTITKRAEAIKVLSLGRPHTTEEEQRFLREIQVQASLDHPNVASVRTAFWTANGLVLAMELVEGESLESIIARGRVPLGTAVGYVLQTLSALIHAHAHSVIHRDIKPGNIVVAPRGTVKLTDFGLAREAAKPSVTSTGSLAGSPFYMSPEQIDGGKLDVRTDIYSLGVVLYELVTGVRPLTGESAFSIMLAHKDTPPAPPMMLEPAIGQALSDIILTSLAKHPSERFQTAADFRYALDAARKALNLSPPTASVSHAEERGAGGLLRWREVHWIVDVVLAVALAVVLVIEGVGLLRRHREARPAVSRQPATAVAPSAAPVETIDAPPPASEPILQPLTRGETENLSKPEAAAPLPPKTVQRKKSLRAKSPEDPVVIVEKTAAPRSQGTAATENADSPPKPAPAAVAVAEDPPAPQAAQPAGDGTAAKPASDPQVKRGNRVWRALGKIVRPWKGSDNTKTQPEQPASE
jgi:serine/threonine-protein kinase